MMRALPSGVTPGGDHCAVTIRRRPRVLALIPAHNEAARIADVVAGALAQLPVLVVDDGSSDDTAARALAAGATVIEQRPNQGKGAALRAGFRWAIGREFDAIVTLDGDGQHDPKEIERFVAAYEAGRPDLLIGARNFRRMPLLRRLGNSLGAMAFSWAVGRRIADNQSGYRLISRRLAEALLDSTESGFGFEIEMITTCVRAGWPIVEVPIRTLYLGGPSHIRPIAHTREFIRLCRSARRLVNS
jgi:glycosyltransferase involved in cell wall biosynthesis